MSKNTPKGAKDQTLAKALFLFIFCLSTCADIVVLFFAARQIANTLVDNKPFGLLDLPIYFSFCGWEKYQTV
jgi:hypothetical protein